MPHRFVNRRGVTAALVAVLMLSAAAPPRAAQPAVAADASSAAADRVATLGGTVTRHDSGGVRGILITDGGGLSIDDMRLFGELPGLASLVLLNCRSLDDSFIEALGTGAPLRTLGVTNAAITDAGVAAIAEAFPKLEELDLSSNTNLGGAAMRSIAALSNLKRLTLVQTRFNDLHTRRLKGLENLEVLDLRGTMEAGDATLGVVGKLPRLRALKHRSTIVTDDGIERLTAAGKLATLLMQDFAISDAAGRHLASSTSLTSLEVFRCQGFGSPGVLALAGLPLERLTLRDLPQVGDDALAVVAELPSLRRLALHELASVSDAGLAQLASADALAALDLWALPLVTDSSARVIAGLPSLDELSIRETAMTAAALDAIVANDRIQSLTFKNGDVPPAVRAKLLSRSWKKLDLGG